MAKDVFGREMDLSHKTTITNKHPLAPCPAESVTPQNDPVVLFDPGTYGSNEFDKGKSESMGAACKITSTHGDGRAIISAIAPTATEGKYGSYIIPATIKR